MPHEEDLPSITAELQSDEELREMSKKSREAYKNGDFLTTSELVKSLCAKDFAK